MDVTLYSTSKKSNSTLVPTGGSTLNGVTLKNECNVLNPVLLIHTSRNFFTSPVTEIGMQGKYYFVTDVKSVRQDLWEVSCEIDVLATYKSEILSNTCMIEFDESPNSNIVDSRLPLLTDVTRTGTIVNMYRHHA